MKALASLPVGTVIQERYIIKSLLGKGDFGNVYLVRDQRDKQKLFVLAELINPADQASYSFVLDYISLSPLDQRTLPQVQNVFNDDKLGQVYVLMSYIEKPNFEMLRLQQPEKRFPLPQVMALMTPVIHAVTYLHHRRPSVIHRNIQPANIIVPQTVDAPVLVMLGIVKEHDSTTTQLHYFAPGYGAPEQYHGEFSARSDIYGLGATFYTLLTGSVPPDALSRSSQLSNGEIDPLKPVNEAIPAIPSAIAEAIQRAMSVDANDRFSSVEQFGEALWSLVERSAPGPGRLSVLTGSPAAPVSELAQAIRQTPTKPLPEPPQAVSTPNGMKEKEGLAVTQPSPEPPPEAPPVVPTPEGIEEQESPAVTEPPPELPPADSLSGSIEEPEELDTAKSLPEPSPFFAISEDIREPEELDAAQPLPPGPPVVLLSESIKESVDLDVLESSPESPPVVALSEDVTEQESPAVTELSPELPPEPSQILSPSGDIHEPEGLEAAKVLAGLPPGPPVVPVPEGNEEPENLDATESSQKPPPMVPMPDGVEGQEDLETTLRLPKRPVIPIHEDTEEQESPTLAKSLPEPSPIVSIAKDTEGQEATDATESSPESLPVASMAQDTKEQGGPAVARRLPKLPRAVPPPISLRTLGMLFFILALLISLGVGAAFLSHARSLPAARSATPAPTVLRSTPKPAPTATSVTSIYPALAGTYNGTIFDISINVSTSMSLTGIQQSQGNISGYLALGPKLQGSGPFSGTIDTPKHVQFIVTDAAGHATLFFEGDMQSADSLSGDYYSCSPVSPAQGGRCRQGPGSYGIWNVGLTS